MNSKVLASRAHHLRAGAGLRRPALVHAARRHRVLQARRGSDGAARRVVRARSCSCTASWCPTRSCGSATRSTTASRCRAKARSSTASYTGIVPDTFKDEAEVVLKGTLSPDGFTVEPNGVMAKCPSKYEAKPGTAALRVRASEPRPDDPTPQAGGMRRLAAIDCSGQPRPSPRSGTSAGSLVRRSCLAASRHHGLTRLLHPARRFRGRGLRRGDLGARRPPRVAPADRERHRRAVPHDGADDGRLRRDRLRVRRRTTTRSSTCQHYSDAVQPLFYKITSYWGGLDGSILFWVFLLSVFGAVAVRVNRERHRELIPYVVAVISRRRDVLPVPDGRSTGTRSTPS